MSETRENHGWDAITNAFAKLYPTQESPLHFAPLIKWIFGGPSPLDGISIYDGGEFWHFVTYGFSELYEKENDDPDDKEYSGYGFELTLQLKKSPAAEDDMDVDYDEIRSMCGNLQTLARYVFQSGRGFEPYQFISTGQDRGMDLHQKSQITGFITVPSELGEIDTPNGKVEFVQLVGATYSELKRIVDKELRACLISP